MPIIDHRDNSVVLRIVYDGPPEAGKTTNLRQLCSRLSLSRRGEMDSPGGGERTQYFDWLDITGGWVGGHRVRCQLVTVPGQIQLARRRRHILDSADVVVFVADSRAGAAPETSAALRSLARGLDHRADVPLVLQANKQDLPGAQPPEQLHAALGLAARVPVVAAEASGGTGVLESFMLAVRLAVDHVRALLVAGELGDGEAAGAADLLRALEADALPVADVFDALDAIARAADPAGLATSPAAIDAAIHQTPPPYAAIAIAASIEASQETTAAADATPDLATVDSTADGALDAGWEIDLPTTPRSITRPIRAGRLVALDLAPAIGAVAPGAAAAPCSIGCTMPEIAPDLARVDSDSITRPTRVIRGQELVPVTAAEPDDAGAPGPVLGPSSDPIAPGPPRRPLRPSRALPAAEPAPAFADPRFDSRGATEPGEPLDPALAESDGTPIEPARPEPLPYFGTDEDLTWELEPVEPRAPTILETGYERSGPVVIESRAATEPGSPAFAEPPPLPRAARRAITASDAAPPGEPHIEVIVAVSRRPPALTPPIPLVPPPPEPLPYQLPPIDLPAGMVWPGGSGRAAIAALGTPVRLVERPLPWAPRAAIELACGDGWTAHSSPELVYADLDAGRPALFDAVRWQAKLTHLTPPGRTYALGPDRDGVRLWVLTPTYRTVWAEIERAFAGGDRAAAGRLAKAGLEAVDELRARGVPIADLEHIAIDDPPRLLATPWTPGRDRLVVQLQRLFAAAVL